MSDFIEIPLVNRTYTFKISSVDAVEALKHRWTTDKNGYVRFSSGKRELFHRWILKPERNQVVDHINHDILDNRRENLRVCFSWQNKQNRKPYIGGSSKFKGVHWIEQNSKWEASISIKNRIKRLGKFDCEIKAALAYDEAATKYYGEFAYLNFSSKEILLVSMCEVEAAKIISTIKQEYSPNGIVDDIRADGDPSPPPLSNSAGDILSSLIQYLPQLAKTTTGINPGIAQSQQDISANISPQQAELNKILYSTYGPQLAQISSDIGRQNLLSAGESQNQLLEQQGNRLATNAKNYQETLDPEFYKTREQAGGALSTLLSPTLSGGEREEITRSLNRDNESRGLVNAPSRLSTVNNAVNFGSSLRSRLGAGLNAAVGALPTFRTGNAPDTLGATAASNQGETRFAGPTQSGNQGFDMANSFLGGLTSLKSQQNDINANRRDSLDRVTGVLGSLPSIS